jgi:hypothetical protein
MLLRLILDCIVWLFVPIALFALWFSYALWRESRDTVWLLLAVVWSLITIVAIVFPFAMHNDWFAYWLM